MGKDVEVHVAISCENITLFNKYYVVNLIRLCIRGLAFLGKGSTRLHTNFHTGFFSNSTQCTNNIGVNSLKTNAVGMQFIEN